MIRRCRVPGCDDIRYETDLCESHYSSRAKKRRRYGYDAPIVLIDKRTRTPGAICIGNRIWGIEEVQALLLATTETQR